MLINCAIDFTNTKYDILLVKANHVYNDDFSIFTDVPYELSNNISFSLFDLDNRLILENIIIKSIEKDAAGYCVAFIDYQKTEQIPRGHYKIGMQINHVYSASMADLWLVSIDDILDKDQSAFIINSQELIIQNEYPR